MDSFGTRLRREREKRKVSLDDLSAATKISNRFLIAIECDRFDQLPGGIFNRGFIRAYAGHLGLDEDQIISEYLAASGEDDPNAPVEPEQAQKVWIDENSPNRNLPWKELAAVLLLIVIAIVFWRVRARESGKPARPAETVLPNSLDNANVAAPVSPAPTPHSEKNSRVTQANSTATNSAASQPFQLRIVPREDSWISVSGPQGEIFHQILSPPEEKSFHSTSRIVVRAGNVGGLDFIWNGRPISSQGKEGEVKTLIFDSTGVHYPPPPPAVTSAPQP
jgi:cytoskeletal protein RodZ